MSIIVQRVPIVTAADGSDTTTVRAAGLRIAAIRVALGTLSTPDITITEEPAGTTIMAVVGLAADATYHPTVEGTDDAGAAVTGSAVPVTVFDRIQIVTAGGGDTKTGEVTFLLER